MCKIEVMLADDHTLVRQGIRSILEMEEDIRVIGEASSGRELLTAIKNGIQPEIILMDEPFSAVDPQTREKLLEDLSRVLAEHHRTTIFVTHNLKEAAQFGDRVAVMIGGELKQAGTPKQIKENPADPSVSDFLRGL